MSSNHLSAITDLKVRADSGDVVACHSLGEKYRVDIELRDLKEAARYYKLAAGWFR
jgi:TPR repeat protein